MHGARRTIWLLAMWLGMVWPSLPAKAEVLKVLPQYVDRQGRVALSPSLFDRDAYQAELRRNPQMRSTMRFQVLWKPISPTEAGVRLRLELRGWSRGGSPQELVLEQAVPSQGTRRCWTSFWLTPEQYEKLGDVTAWRVTLWAGTTLVGEQKSFLWDR